MELKTDTVSFSKLIRRKNTANSMVMWSQNEIPKAEVLSWLEKQEQATALQDPKSLFFPVLYSGDFRKGLTIWLKVSEAT